MSDYLSGQLDSERWGAKIRSLRREKDWSQSDLADRLNVHSQTVSDLERGRSRLTLERLNRVLGALGFEARIEVKSAERTTRADWGAIAVEEPSLRRRVERARRLAEAVAEFLYAEYDLDRVYCFGSLGADGGSRFGPDSDVDIGVKGLAPSSLFRAESRVEMEVVESSSEFEGLSVELVRVEDLDRNLGKLVDRGEAVLLPD